MAIFFIAQWHTGLAQAQASNDGIAQESDDRFTQQDRWRGSITPERAWWDLKHYELSIRVMPESRTISGTNQISFSVLKPAKRMQIDLQEPLEISSVRHNDEELSFERDGNVYWIEFPNLLDQDSQHQILIAYAGKPVESKNPPWSGGFSWQTDEKGKPFIATSCQGIGASIWWPCKDHGYDEPDDGVRIHATVPKDLVAVSNGRLTETIDNEEDETKTFSWEVTNPINNYSVNVNIGNYVNFSETIDGEGGKLTLDYWTLDHQRKKAETHFKEAPRTIKAFEHWFGKYPFYEDTYKLVVVPYLGMEHQSSVTYGNGFRNGYKGTDLSETGVGLKFDFIIVHESGHEWFGNNISMKDAADMWIHESFTNYSENLFIEYHFSKKEAQDYVIGCRKKIRNDSPIIGTYNVNNSGSGDMYYKGGNMLHTLRHMVNDDEKWRSILRGLNETFWHQTVTTQQIEDYLSVQSGLKLDRFFDQYLRSTKIPVLKYSYNDHEIRFKFDNVVAGFAVPVKVLVNGKPKWITPTESEQVLKIEAPVTSFELDRNFYMEFESLDSENKKSSAIE